MAEIIITGINEDGTYFPIEKLEAHRCGVKHLAISIFLFHDNMLLIQKRADQKYHCGGLWANTCCSHPEWNEDFAECADRRLKDELGITAKLSSCGIVEYRAEVGKDLIENERVQLFRGVVPSRSVNFRLNPQEVSETRWVTLADLTDEISENPEHFAPWFRIYIEKHQNLFALAS